MPASVTFAALLLSALALQAGGDPGRIAGGDARVLVAETGNAKRAISEGWPAGTIVNDPFSAYDAASKQQRPLTIFFAANWCSYCFKMKEGALSHPDLAGLWTRGIFLLLDVDQDDSFGNTRQLMARLKIEEFPAFAVLDVLPQSVTLRGRIVGFHTPVQFCGSLRQVQPTYFADAPADKFSETGCKPPEALPISVPVVPRAPASVTPPPVVSAPAIVNPTIEDYLTGRKKQ